MLTTAEVTSMIACVTDSLPDTAIISRRTLSVDTRGGQTASWATVSTVTCRLSPIKLIRGAEVEENGAEHDVESWLVTLPANTDVRPTDRVVINTRTFEIVGGAGQQSWELFTGLRCQEVK